MPVRHWRGRERNFGRSAQDRNKNRNTITARPWASHYISWAQVIDEIGDKLIEIRAKSGPESTYWLGSAKFPNEAAYLFRKFAAFWGTNNADHQARICHSTTVAGVANTWGYGAMTNSYNDIRRSKTLLIMGGNPAEAHPVSLQHLLTGKELNRANFLVIDPRMTRTAAHSTDYVRIRPGTDIPAIWGMLWHSFKNGWEDKVRQGDAPPD
jgi:formate dehydrogenase major subunit